MSTPIPHSSRHFSFRPCNYPMFVPNEAKPITMPPNTPILSTTWSTSQDQGDASAGDTKSLHCLSFHWFFKCRKKGMSMSEFQRTVGCDIIHAFQWIGRTSPLEGHRRMSDSSVANVDRVHPAPHDRWAGIDTSAVYFIANRHLIYRPRIASQTQWPQMRLRSTHTRILSSQSKSNSNAGCLQNIQALVK